MKCGLVGANLSYSYSKIIHNMLADYEYELYSIPQEEFTNFIQTANYDGLNITIPYKQLALTLCDTVSREAQEIGCVNTIVRDRSGKLHGYNTDYNGFLFMAKIAGISFSGKHVLILGSGGTSLTARTAIQNSGALEITIVSRSGQINYENIYQFADQCDIIINTTPIGTYPNNNQQLIDLTRFPHCKGILDVVYNPLSTHLVLSAKELNIPCSGGIPMLVAQAVSACRLFSGGLLEEDKTADILHTLLVSMRNIVLTGMPGSGKTSIGFQLATKLNRPFLDTDILIEEKSCMTIPEIFSRYGEEAFRKYEKEVIMECGKLTGKVIATGGGAMLSHENYLSLAQNGRIYCLTRELSKLSTDGRPLSRDGDLARMFENRLPSYKKHSHMMVSNNGPLESTITEILDDFQLNANDIS